MSILKKPYEISIWEDKLTFVTPYGEFTEISSIQGPIISQYYKEQKIAIIGSNVMNSDFRVRNPVLETNINGTSTLTFSLYSRYYDEESNNFIDNPFKSFLSNERKVKLKYGESDNCKWYDFIIKEIQEDSEKEIFTYIAKDLFINELAKNGFNLQFDKELENNIGNLDTLAKKILKESDWKLKNDGLILEQTKEEPLYKIKIKADIVAKNIKKDKPDVSLKQGNYIYVFYSVIDGKEDYFQFIYCQEPYKKDERRILTNKDCNYYLMVEYSPNGDIICGNKIIGKYDDLRIFSDFQGKRYVRKQLTKYDSAIDKYVQVYSLNGKEVYGFCEKEYLSTNSIISYITNSKNFTNTSGWNSGVFFSNTDPTLIPDINLAMVPDIRDISSSEVINTDSYLTFNSKAKNQFLFNSGLIDFRSQIKELIEGQTYIFRMKYGLTRDYVIRPTEVNSTSIGFKIKIAPYEVINGAYSLGQLIFEGSLSQAVNSITEYQEVRMTCQHSLSYSEMLGVKNQLGLFIEFNDLGKFYIKDVQFFLQQLKDENGTMSPNNTYYPEELLQGQVKTTYYYYEPNKSYKDKNDIVYYYKGNKPNLSFQPKYNVDSFEKVRTIEGSESNRFNLLQSLCELFQCWVKFEIYHKPNGEILLGKDLPEGTLFPEEKEEELYRQQKFVTFYETQEQRNNAGFKYGINLKAIKREIESDGFVSKIIVKDNSNQFGKDGFCSIARASENYSKENFILDFSYYIQQGLLDYNQINNDLYSQPGNPQGYIGYYKSLKKFNMQSYEKIEEQTLLSTDILKTKSSISFLEKKINETQEQLKSSKAIILSLTGLTFQDLQNNKENSWWKDDKVISEANLIAQLQNFLNNQNSLLEKEKFCLRESTSKYDNNKLLIKRNLEEKEKLHKKFFKKYSRFIQEGSWISEDYFDDNLYYFDAETTLHASAQPKIKYNIDVLELSQIPGYENYSFKIGDKSFIEDTEFFGWTYKDGIKTPYKEEIIVTELKFSLDSPEDNVVTIQNYKTQFEDLFQRITATTQQLEFHSGEYGKVSSIIEPNGSIKFETLQNSFSNNSFVLQNAKNQSVIWDDTGITTTSLSNPNEIVRLVSGGLFLSTDGGLNWNTGITGKGINANYLTSGSINTNQINILSGSFPSFRWDSEGLSAYAFSLDPVTKKPSNFNYGKFVRLDQFGLYMIDLPKEFSALQPDEDGKIGEEKIKKNSIFSLTQGGFQIKSKHSDKGYISITSNRDFEVVNNENFTQVKIGLLSQGNGKNLYGIQIADALGHIVIEQGSEGKVWIKDTIRIGQDRSSVSLGFLPGFKTVKSNNKEENKDLQIHQVINANDKFIVYEDGSMHATDGHFEGEGIFSGTIYATSGKIGNLTIGEIQDQVKPQYHIDIISEQGDTFKVDSSNKVSPLALKLKLDIGKIKHKPEDTVVWYYSQDFINWHIINAFNNLFSPILEYDKITFKQDIYYLKAEYSTISEGETTKYIDYKTFYKLTDGTQGKGPVEVKVSCNKGNILVNNKTPFTLSASVWQDNEDITAQFDSSAFSWEKIDKDGQIDNEWTNLHQKYGKEVIITNLEIDQKANFKCTVNI